MKTAIPKTQASVARKTEPFFNKGSAGKFFGAGKAVVQRKCEHCEQEEKVQRQPVGAGAAAGPVATPGAASGAGAAAAPMSKTCGPDVSGSVAAVWTKIQTDFAGWSPTDKLAASLYLISPFVPTAGANPRSGGGAALFSGSWGEPFADVLASLLDKLGYGWIGSMISSPASSWQLNRDAFDTVGLFVLSADWLLNLPGCGEPHCAALGGGGLPRGYSDPCEDPASCGITVQMGSSCWLSGTVNYGTYGVMMREAYKWCDTQRGRLLGLLPTAALMELLPGGSGVAYILAHMDRHEIAAAFLKELFSPVSLVIYVGGYKLWDKENPLNALAWALATYSGGPGGKAGGGNRPGCATGCPQTGAAFPSWDYVWEPVKHR